MSYVIQPAELLRDAALLAFAVACLQDWAMRLVPNSIPIAIAALGAVTRLIDGTMLLGLAAAIVVFVVAVCCWRRGWLGGADVKLFAAGALLVPPPLVIKFVLTACVAGGVLAILYAALGAVVPAPAPLRPANRIRRYLRLEQRRLRRKGPLPYATAIAAGACFVLLGN